MLDEPQPQAHSSSTAHAQLHWGSALVAHQMFNVISLLKVVTKPQRVKRRQSVNQSSLYIFFISIILHLMSLFLVCELLIVYFCLSLWSLFLILMTLICWEYCSEKSCTFLQKRERRQRHTHYSLTNPEVQDVLPSTAGGVMDALIYISIPSDCCWKLWWSGYLPTKTYNLIEESWIWIILQATRILVEYIEL